MPTEEGIPGRHPDPPTALSGYAPVLTQSNGPWLRLHATRFDPIYFNRAGRYGAPGGEYGVLYAAEDAYGSFIETFGYDTGVRIIDEVDLRRRGLAEIRANRPLRLIDLTGEGLAKIGADGRLVTGEHVVARKWSAALRAHPTQPDGIYYPCRHDLSRTAVALYDHTAGTLSYTPCGTLLDAANKALLAKILHAYGFTLV